MTKAQLVQRIAEKMNLQKTQVVLFFEQLGEVAEEQLAQNGRFIVPDLVKFTLRDSPAKPERVGRNPATNQPMTLPAKAASKRVSASPIGELKRKLSS